MGDPPRRLLRHARCDPVRAAATTHLPDEGRGRTQYSDDVHSEPWRGDYGFEYCAQVGCIGFVTAKNMLIPYLVLGPVRIGPVRYFSPFLKFTQLLTFVMQAG